MSAAFKPQFEDIPERLRKLAQGVPGLKTPVWYSGSVLLLGNRGVPAIESGRADGC